MHSAHPTPIVDAHFEPTEEAGAQAASSLIRRAPHVETAPREALAVRPVRDAGGEMAAQKGRVSMALSDWLQVDRTMHELYTLVEVAIQQRDDARGGAETTAERAGEWEAYARELEAKLQAAHIENLELRHEAWRAHDLVDEALQLSPFGARRRRVLRARLEYARHR